MFLFQYCAVVILRILHELNEDALTEATCWHTILRQYLPFIHSCSVARKVSHTEPLRAERHHYDSYKQYQLRTWTVMTIVTVRKVIIVQPKQFYCHHFLAHLTLSVLFSTGMLSYCFPSVPACSSL